MKMSNSGFDWVRQEPAEKKSFLFIAVFFIVLEVIEDNQFAGI